MREGRWTDRLHSGARALAPRLQLSAPAAGRWRERAEIDLSALDDDPPAELLLYLGDLLERVSDARRPTLLLLDEVQELARHERHGPLVAALRTALDTRSDRLRAVFTGSSQAGLQTMFSEREAPFFHFATPLDLPPLGAPFVDHLLSVHEDITGTRPDRNEAGAVFERLHSNPYFFRLVVESLVLDPRPRCAGRGASGSTAPVERPGLHRRLVLPGTLAKGRGDGDRRRARRVSLRDRDAARDR